MNINFALAVKMIYPDAKPNIDFVNRVDEDGTQYFSEWNYDQPEPTIDAIHAAWEEYLANPPAEPLTEIEEIKKKQDLMQEALDELLLGGM